MKTKESPLQIGKIYISGSHIVAIHPENDEKLNDFVIDIDFDIHTHKDKKGIMVTMEVNGNDIDAPVPGYIISVLADAYFNLPADINEDDKKALIRQSSLQMVISYIRGYIANVTSYGYFGQYMLPAIDLNDLLQKKFEEASKKAKKAN